MGTVVFLLAVLIGVPLCVLIGRVYKPFLYFILFLLVFSTAEVYWSITFMSREFYKTATRGFEVHVLDLCAVILAISMLLRPAEYRLRWRLPMVLPYILLLALGTISWLAFNYTPGATHLPKDLLSHAAEFELGLYPLFELSKLIRGLFVFWVIANFVVDQTSLRVLLCAIAAVIIFVTIQCFINRYVYGEFRVTIRGMHFNDFNVYIGMLGVFLLPWAFSSKSKMLSLGIWMMFLLALTCIILTVSRSSLIGFFLGSIFVIMIALLRYPNGKNVFSTIFFFLSGFLLVLKASKLLIARFVGAEGDIAYRDLLKETATMMANDYFFGVGMGNYSAMTYLKYSAIVRAEPFIVAHNIWYLTVAEVGYIGLLAFILIWVSFYYFLIIGLFRTRRIIQPNAYETFLGTLGASIPLQFQGLYHFSFRQTSVFFLFIIMTATAATFYYIQRRQRVIESGTRT